MVTLKKGITYHISFAQTYRVQESGAASILGVYLDGELLSSTSCDETLVWKTNTVDITPAADITAKLMFADEGTTVQSYGVLLDDVKMEYEENHQVPVPEFPTVALPGSIDSRTHRCRLPPTEIQRQLILGDCKISAPK